MSFWRREVIEPALGEDTESQIREQRDWIAREPSNARPYYQLAMLYRMKGRQDDALGLLLEAVHLDPSLAAAHTALAEMYAVRDDLPAARTHAEAARKLGDATAVDLLRRYGHL